MTYISQYTKVKVYRYLLLSQDLLLSGNLIPFKETKINQVNHTFFRYLRKVFLKGKKAIERIKKLNSSTCISMSYTN